MGPHVLRPKAREMVSTPRLSLLWGVWRCTVLLECPCMFTAMAVGCSQKWRKDFVDINFQIHLEAFGNEDQRALAGSRDRSPNHHTQRLLTSTHCLQTLRDVFDSLRNDEISLPVECLFNCEDLFIEKRQSRRAASRSWLCQAGAGIFRSASPWLLRLRTASNPIELMTFQGLFTMLRIEVGDVASCLAIFLIDGAKRVSANPLPDTLDTLFTAVDTPGSCSHGARSSTLLSIFQITTLFKSSNSSPNSIAVNLQSPGDIHRLFSCSIEVDDGLTLRVHSSWCFQNCTNLDEPRSYIRHSNFKICAMKISHEFNFWLPA